MIDPEGLSRNEKVKASSNHLRGTIAEELGADASTFTEDATQVLKFHGVYQQDDRDGRTERKRQRGSTSITSAWCGSASPAGS